MKKPHYTLAELRKPNTRCTQCGEKIHCIPGPDLVTPGRNHFATERTLLADIRETFLFREIRWPAHFRQAARHKPLQKETP